MPENDKKIKLPGMPKPRMPKLAVPGFVKKHKRLFIFLLIAIIAGAGYTFYQRAASEASYLTDTAARRDIRTEHFFSGTVEPLLSQEVMSAITGVRVTEVLVKEGDEVHKGDILFRLDSKSIEDQMKEKEASMAHSSRSNSISLQEAQAEYDNLADNIDNGLDTTVQNALNGIDSAMAALAKAQENYNTEVLLNNNQMSEKLRTAINAVNSAYRQRDNATDARKDAETVYKDAIKAGTGVSAARASLAAAERSEEVARNDYRNAVDQFEQAKILEASNLTLLYQALIDAQNNYLHAINAQSQKLENLSLKIAAAKENGDTTLDELQLEKLGNQLNDYAIKATINGQITKLSVKEGDVTAVNATTSLATITDSATASVLNSFAGLGAGALSVSVHATDLKPGLTEMDLTTIRALNGVSNVAPSAEAALPVRYEDVSKKEIPIEGKDPIALNRGSLTVEKGRAFTAAESDGQTQVALVDKTFVQKVMKGHSPIGKDILVGGLTYHVIGVLKDTRNEYMYMYGDFNGTVYVPYKNAMRMNNTGVITSIDVYIQDGYQDAVVEQTLRNALDKMFNKAKKAYTVTNMASVRRMEENTNRLLSGMTGGIASIALLVGGIGIMNMMLVSVTERTKEIGLRKALGAEPKRIQAQFLIESIVLSVIGGTIGIILGLVIAFAATKLIQVDFDLSVSAILIGFGFATAVGVIFGWAPARRASRLNPIDALRTE